MEQKMQENTEAGPSGMSHGKNCLTIRTRGANTARRSRPYRPNTARSRPIQQNGTSENCEPQDALPDKIQSGVNGRLPTVTFPEGKRTGTEDLPWEQKIREASASSRTSSIDTDSDDSNSTRTSGHRENELEELSDDSSSKLDPIEVVNIQELPSSPESLEEDPLQ